MKKLFFRNDHTIRMETIYCCICILAALGILLIYLISKSGKGITYQSNTTTGLTTTTTTMMICNDCSFSFKDKDIRIKPDNTYLLKDLIDYKNITLKMIKFTVDDRSLLKIETNSKGEVVLKTLNKVGHAKITAKYGDLEDSVNVSISQSEYESAKLKDNTYYVYEGKTSPIELVTSPEGGNASTFTIETDNNDILSFDENNNIIGKKLGEANIKLNYKNSVSSSLVYVINNRITIKVKENDIYNYYDEYKYVSTYDGSFELSVTFEDNKNMSYDNSNLSYIVENHGKMKLDVQYVEKNILENNSYIYKVNVNTITSDSSDNYAFIVFTLSDGSKSRIKISR